MQNIRTVSVVMGLALILLFSISKVSFASQFDIAHLHEQGQDMVIVPLESSFGNKSNQEQHQFIEALQDCAEGAGVAGTVVPVWEKGISFYFIAPKPWIPFFKGMTMKQVSRNINKQLTCE